MIEVIGAVLVISILAFIVGTVVKGALRFVGFLVLAALAVMAVGQPLTSRLPVVSNWLKQLSAEVQSETQIQSNTGENGQTGGSGGFRSAPFTNAETNQPITQASPDPLAPNGSTPNSNTTNGNTTNGATTGSSPSNTTAPSQAAPNTTTGSSTPSNTATPNGTVSSQETPFPRPRSDSPQGSGSGGSQRPVTAWW
jgi:hypothetical protein